MTVFDVISLAGGLALFLYGMRIMGDGLQSGSSEALKRAMEKVTNNPMVGFMLGLLVTAVIQSSTATIVLTSGLVGAGILTLHQSIGIILGANVGTTVTGQIIRLLDINAGANSWLNVLKPSTLAPLAAIAGILMIMAMKSDKFKVGGTIAMGFAILFTGLLGMTAAVEPLSQSETFGAFFIRMGDRPVLGFLAGAAAAFAIQSSSATIGILQALSVTGQLTFSSVYAIIVGIYIGDCVTTAIVCSIGAKADAKRTGMVHILFNIGVTVLVMAGVTIFKGMGLLDGLWDRTINSGGIANTHTVFRLACALLLLPVCGVFERLACRIIRDDKPADTKEAAALTELETLDDTFFKSPALAFAAIHSVMAKMGAMANDNVLRALGTLTAYDKETIAAVEAEEDRIDRFADALDGYMIRMFPFIKTDSGNEDMNYYMRCVAEFERISDYAVNITENAENMRQRGIQLSGTAREELAVVSDALAEIMNLARYAFAEGSIDIAKKIEPVEEVVDDIVAVLRDNHLRRLREGLCTTDAGILFMDMLVNVERISDQCSNIGLYTIADKDPDVQVVQHDYIRQLHVGADETYNRDYQETKQRYFRRLESLLEKN